MALDKVLSTSIANGAVTAAAISNTANLVVGSITVAESSISGNVNIGNVVLSTNSTGLIVSNGQLLSTGNVEFNNLAITGNLTVSGTTTYINTNQLEIGDNIISLNSDLPANTTPTEDAGISINRGNASNVSILWDETNDNWTFNNQPVSNVNSIVIANSFTVAANGNIGVRNLEPIYPISSTGMCDFNAIFNGRVVDSINENTGVTLVHRLGQSQGFQFCGDFIVNSWTGNAFINMHLTSRYPDDLVEVSVVSAISSPGISKVIVKLVTVSYDGGSYLGIRKDGGGIGVSYLNAFLTGNMAQYGGVREIRSGFTVTTTHATLN